MIKKGNPGDGFLLCFFLNLLFNFWWGLIAVVLLILFFVLGISIFWSILGFFIWFGIAFLSTALVVWAVSTAEDTTPQRENLNPYSAKTSDILPASAKQEILPDTEETSDILPASAGQEILPDTEEIPDIDESIENVEKSE